MKTKHTPGEWKLIETFNHFCISDRDDFMSTNNEFGNIATVDQNAINYCGKKEAKANAKLIEAAPDLLEALEELRIAVGNNVNKEWNRFLDEAYRKAIKTIKKATE